MSDATQTPLIDLLADVPIDAHDFVDEGLSSHHIPYGRLCHDAAEELRRLHAENAELLSALKKADQQLLLVPIMSAYAADKAKAVENTLRKAILRAEGESK